MNIEINIQDKEELEYLQSCLATVIHQLSLTEENNQDSIYWLSQILVLSYHQH